MNITKLITLKEKQLRDQNYIEFSNEEFAALKLDEVQLIVDNFHGRALMQIPQTEIKFFQWLQKNDPSVWDDIWKDEENLYLVSIDLLPQFIEGGNRFPICDLIDQPNYWFNARHIKPKGLMVLEDILTKLEMSQKLNLEEAFLLELSIMPTDIWHFCYTRNVSINVLKDIVEDLVYNGLIVHLPDRDDLVKYIDL